MNCTSRAARSPQPLQLRLDVIERSLGSVQARALPVEGGVTDPRLIDLRPALYASYQAVDDARRAVRARETGDGRFVDEEIGELRQRLANLDRILARAEIPGVPGLDVLATTDDDGPDASEDAP
jgi:hypothetical protein